MEGNTSSNNSDYSQLPRGLLGRRGVPITRGTRLPSIWGPKDLTLGGAPKRTFKPNIPVRRDPSNEAKDKSQTKSDSPKEARGGRNTFRDNERGRGRGRGRDLIQISGIFSEGPSASKKKAASSSGSVVKNATAVPKFTKSKQLTKEEENADDEMLKNLMRDDFIDDLEENHIYPVTLPLTSNLKNNVKSDVQKTDNNVVKIKHEVEDIEMQDLSISDSKVNIIKQEPGISTQSAEVPEVSPKDLFSRTKMTEGSLLFMQLPDCLPRIPLNSVQYEDIEPSTSRENGSEELTSGINDSKKQNESTASSSCSLAEYPEGYIGKLQVMKSGKTRLILGPVILNVEMGTPVGFLQDVVSVKVNENSGDMYMLGHIDHRLVCVPDMETLLEEYVS